LPSGLKNIGKIDSPSGKFAERAKIAYSRNAKIAIAEILKIYLVYNFSTSANAKSPIQDWQFGKTSIGYTMPILYNRAISALINNSQLRHKISPLKHLP